METNKIRAIITGTTGMVGEGVLMQCLQNPEIEAILIVNRRPLGMSHPKLKEIIHPDFNDLSAIESSLKGYNACFFCLGTSSVGMNEADYTKVTYTLTMHVANTLSRINPDMTFNYVSGAGTNSSEKGGSMWSRVKGKTENDLMKLPFKQVYAFRPGFIKPLPRQKRVNKYYKYVNWMFPIGRKLFPGGFARVAEIGDAMARVVNHPYSKKVIEGKDIIVLAMEADYTLD